MDFIMQMQPWFGEEEKKAICEYMDENGFITEFKRTEKFEQILAEYTGSKHCIVVNNGTISLTLAAMAVGVEAGDSAKLYYDSNTKFCKNVWCKSSVCRCRA